MVYFLRKIAWDFFRKIKIKLCDSKNRTLMYMLKKNLCFTGKIIYNMCTKNIPNIHCGNLCNGILFSPDKVGNAAICNKMGELEDIILS